MVLPVGTYCPSPLSFPVLSSVLCLNSSFWIDLSTFMITALEILLMKSYSDKFFPFQFSRYVIILSSFLKTSLAGYPIPGSELFFFFPFKHVRIFSLPSVLHTAGEKSAIILICVSCRYSSLFSMAAFKVFFLSWLSCSMTMCMTLHLSLFIWIRIHWVSRTWWFACFINSRKALVNLYMNSDSHLFFRHSV